MSDFYMGGRGAEINDDILERKTGSLQYYEGYDKQLNYDTEYSIYRHPAKTRSLSLLDVDNLISISSKKLTNDPQHRKALFIRASSYMKKGQYSKAIQDCNQLIKSQDQNCKVGALYIRGCVHQKLGEMKNAIHDFSAVLHIDPNHINAAYARGACMNKIGDYQKAIQDYVFALQVDKQRPLSPRKIPQWKADYILNQPICLKSDQSLCNNNINSSGSDLYSMTFQTPSKNGGRTSLQSRQRQQSSQTLQSPPFIQTQDSLYKDNSMINSSFDDNHFKGQMIKKHNFLKLQNATILSQVQSSLQANQQQHRAISSTSPHQAQELSNHQQQLLHQQQLQKQQQQLQNHQLRCQLNQSYLNKSPPSLQSGLLSNDSSLQATPTMLSNLQSIATSPVRNFVPNFKNPNLNEQQQQLQQQQHDAEQLINTKIQHLSQQQKKIKKMQAQKYHTLGYQARKKGDYNLAIQYYTVALQIYPEHFKVAFNRGFAYDKIGQYDMAISDYERAIHISPTNPYPFYNLGISLDKKGQYDAAILYFDKAIQLDPTKADFFHNRGFAWRKKRKLDQAIADYSQAIARDDKHFKAYYNRAFCYDQIGNLILAESDYSQAYILDPNNANALYHLATIQEKIETEQSLRQAVTNFTKLIQQLDSQFTLAYNGSGLAKDKLKMHQQAIKDFTLAIEKDPNNSLFRYNRGCSYRNMGKLQKSLKDIDESLRLNPKNSLALSFKGLIYRKQCKYIDAIREYSYQYQILASSTNNTMKIKCLNNRAFCFAKIDQFKQAIRDYSEVLILSPDNVHALHNRGISYQRTKEFRKGIKDFSQAIKIQPNNANAHFNRGICYDQVGELQKAIADYSRALQLDMRQNQGVMGDDGQAMQKGRQE